ncbi:AraC family transcriptional regulator [Sphingopyxis sp. Root154]|nr:AraC family transcriptional regulator [Sphingopyxis sp. Root154]
MRRGKAPWLGRSDADHAKPRCAEPVTAEAVRNCLAFLSGRLRCVTWKNALFPRRPLTPAGAAARPIHSSLGAGSMIAHARAESAAFAKQANDSGVRTPSALAEAGAGLAMLRHDVCRLEQYTVFESTQVEEVQRKLTEAVAPHRLIVAEPAMDASLRRIRLGDLAILLLRYGAKAVVLPKCADDLVLVKFILSGECEVSDRDGRFTARAGDILILESLRCLRLVMSSDCEELIVPLRRADIAAVSEALSGRTPPRSFDFDRHFNMGDLNGTALIRLLQYLIVQATASHDSAAVLAVPVTSLLIHHLLLNHAAVRHANCLPRTTVVPYYIRRAEAFMAENVRERVTLGCLADHAGVSVRTITSGFRRFRGESPLAILRDLRLQRARDQLLDPRAGSVTEVALRCGFAHFSRFASAYRARFGESPSATLAKVRPH